MSPARKALALLCFYPQPYFQLSLALLRCVVSPTNLLSFVSFALFGYITSHTFVFSCLTKKGWIPTGLFLIGHTCHRIENGGGLRNISNPESGNSILLGTGTSPPVSGNSILDTNTIKRELAFMGEIPCPPFLEWRSWLVSHSFEVKRQKS